MLATVGFATLGLAVGLFLRSAVFAVIVGLAYLIAVESIIGRVLPALNRVATRTTSAWSRARG